jgi:hypothetical protein
VRERQLLKLEAKLDEELKNGDEINNLMARVTHEK